MTRYLLFLAGALIRLVDTRSAIGTVRFGRNTSLTTE